MRQLVAGVIAALALLVAMLPAAAGAAEPRTTLPDVEDEVMCVQCGTPLSNSASPVADRTRAFIRKRIEQGKTKEQIKADLVAEFGPRVLAMPEGRGFNAGIWVVPAVLGIGGLALIVIATRRWRGESTAGTVSDAAHAPPARDLDPVDERRLDAELAAYDP